MKAVRRCVHHPHAPGERGETAQQDQSQHVGATVPTRVLAGCAVPVPKAAHKVGEAELTQLNGSSHTLSTNETRWRKVKNVETRMSCFGEREICTPRRQTI